MAQSIPLSQVSRSSLRLRISMGFALAAISISVAGVFAPPFRVAHAAVCHNSFQSNIWPYDIYFYVSHHTHSSTYPYYGVHHITFDVHDRFGAYREHYHGEHFNCQ